ncbi:MAG TPA: hypothetical protein VGU66_09015 [Candidatus Elarobacter sp.]|nr:hypothetical protein [Candidatus Elarobacter sp.]
MQFFVFLAAACAAVGLAVLVDGSPAPNPVVALVNTEVRQYWSERDVWLVQDARALLEEQWNAAVLAGTAPTSFPAALPRVEPCVPSGAAGCATTTTEYVPVGTWRGPTGSASAERDLVVRVIVTSVRTADGMLLARESANFTVRWSPSGMFVQPASDEAMASAKAVGS